MDIVEKGAIWREVDAIGNDVGRSVVVIDSYAPYVIVENLQNHNRCRMLQDSLRARFKKVDHVATLGPEVGEIALAWQEEGLHRPRTASPRLPRGPR
jgi:hypothetical protein